MFLTCVHAATALAAPPVINSPALQEAEVGQFVDYQIKTEGNNAESYNATNLPAGVTVNTQTGRISGTPLLSAIGHGSFQTYLVKLSARLGSETGKSDLNIVVRHRQRPVSTPPFPGNLESRQGAPGIIYLDFDGEPVISSSWNGGEYFYCHPSGLNDTQVRLIFEAVKEDFRPFNVNVTTNRQLYDARASLPPPYKRVHMIITPTNSFIKYNDPVYMEADAACPTLAFSSAGAANPATMPGIAWIHYFNEDGSILQAPRDLASSISHELGHAFGLAHDGGNASYVPTWYQSKGYGEYFLGTGRWASQGPPALVGGNISSLSVWTPLMGSNTYGFLTQWSQGEYWGYKLDPTQTAQTNPDDVSFIAGPVNGIGYAPDPEGDSVSTATNVVVSDQIVFDGSIGRESDGTPDFDVLRFTLSGPAVLNFLVSPREPMNDLFPDAAPLEQQRLNLGITNLYMAVELLDAAGSNIEFFAKGSASPWLNNPEGLEPAEFFRRRLTNKHLPAGAYLLRIYGTHRGDPNTRPTEGTVEGIQTLTDLPGYFSAYGSMGAYKVRGSIDYEPVISSASTVSGQVGNPVTHQIVASGYPTSYAAVNLPPGLVIDSLSGLISGVPVTAGTFIATVSVYRNQAVTRQSLTFQVTGEEVIADATDTAGLAWTTPPGFFGWFRQTVVTYNNGPDAAQSADIGDNQKAAMETTVTGPGTLSFYWRVSSEYRWDFLRFEIDGVEQARIHQEVDWEQRSYTLTSGLHTLRWVYQKDGSNSAGSDAGWVDQVRWQEQTVIYGPVSDTAEEGQPYSSQIVASGGTVLTYGVSGAKIPGLDVNPQTGAIFGTPTTPGTQSMLLTASNGVNSASVLFTLNVQPSPNTALDTTALAFTRPDAKKWFGQRTVVSDGVDAMQSPALNHGEQASIETTVTGPGTIDYYWKADSEPADKLTLTIGSTVVDSIYGTADWIWRTQQVPAGVQTLRWTFKRDANGSAGSDAAWLDRVSFTGATGPVITSPLTVNWTVGQIGFVPLTSNDPATVWSTDNRVPPWAFFQPSPVNAIGAVPALPGTFSFSLFATNSLGTTTRAFTMYVQSSYTGWAVANGPGAGSESGDFDKDGISNFAEVALGLDPKVRTAGYQPVTFDPVSKRLKAVFIRRNTQYYSDIKYEVQVSVNLQTWTTIAQFGDPLLPENLGAQSIGGTPLGSDNQMVVVDGLAQTGAVARRWMRLKVSQRTASP